MKHLLRNILINFSLVAFCLFSSFYAKSQAFAPPTGINYQAIARDTAGAPIANAGNLSVTFTIWNALTGGSTLYTETHHNVSTNKYGLFTRVIGSADSAGFNAIDWSIGDKFIEIGIDSGGTGFVYMPRTQLLSVPYAYHAKTADYGIYNWSLNGNWAASTNFIGTQNNADLIFKTNNTEQMRLLPSGFLGLGTNAPTSPLTIQTLSGPGTELEFSSSGFNADIYANSQFNIGSLTSLNLLTAGSNRLFIGPAGNVGIGTVSPVAKFDVNGNIKIVDGTQGLSKVLTSDATGLAHWDTIPLPYILGNGLSLSAPNTLNSVWSVNGNHIYNNNSGWVGIGTSTPRSQLEVVSDTNNLPRGIVSTQYHSAWNTDAQIWINRAGGSSSSPQVLQAGDEIGFIKFRGWDGAGFNTNDQTEIGAVASESFTSSANGSYLKFMTTPNGSTSGVERMRIENNGNVGINTTTPSSKLDVEGTITISGSNNNHELNRNQTGAANLVPIAYGSVNSGGSLNANTGNISCSWNGSLSAFYYTITIAGENYDTQNYITQVTVIGNNAKAEVNDDGNGNLVVTIWSFANGKMQCPFQFVTYKP